MTNVYIFDNIPGIIYLLAAAVSVFLTLFATVKPYYKYGHDPIVYSLCTVGYAIFSVYAHMFSRALLIMQASDIMWVNTLGVYGAVIFIIIAGGIAGHFLLQASPGAQADEGTMTPIHVFGERGKRSR